MTTIVAIKRGNNGSFAEFKLDNGEILDYNQTVDAIKAGKISGCNVGKDIYGYDSIKSNRNDSFDDNLNMLPEF